MSFTVPLCAYLEALCLYAENLMLGETAFGSSVVVPEVDARDRGAGEAHAAALCRRLAGFWAPAAVAAAVSALEHAGCDASGVRAAMVDYCGRPESDRGEAAREAADALCLAADAAHAELYGRDEFAAMMVHDACAWAQDAVAASAQRDDARRTAEMVADAVWSAARAIRAGAKAEGRGGGPEELACALRMAIDEGIALGYGPEPAADTRAGR